LFSTLLLAAFYCTIFSRLFEIFSMPKALQMYYLHSHLELVMQIYTMTIMPVKNIQMKRLN